VEKHVTATHATDNIIIRRERFACWITKATDTYSEYVILNNGYAKAPQLYVVHIACTVTNTFSYSFNPYKL
jgi:hypothetical protein